MTRRNLLFAALAVVVAAVCVRLGFWQLSRLRERRAVNAVVAERLRMPAVTALAHLPADTAAARFRRVRLTGRYDFAHEIRLTGRSHGGSPGVNVITPLRLADTNVAVLVNRGWVYSPNGADVDLSRWREEVSATVVGFVSPLAPHRGGTRAATGDPRAVRWIDNGALAREAGYPVTPFTVVIDRRAVDGAAPSSRADSTPVRLDAPPLDEGPHLSYAIQWFSFATIAVVGAGLVVSRARRERERNDRRTE